MSGTMNDLTTDGFQKWLEDMTSIDATGYGNDSTPIQQNNPIADYIHSHSLDPNSLLLQQWILGKESGLQTRSAMGYEAVYLCSRVLESINLYNDLYQRQSDVEQRMTKTEGDFQKVVANATVDSEVILARSSDLYGDYKTLDARLENDEKILAQFAPIGFRVTINHGLGIDPKLTVHTYHDAIGTETNGLGTAPTGLGETGTQTVPVLASYPDGNTLMVDMPKNYTLNGTPQPALDGNYYLIDGNKTLKFDIGGLQKPKPNLLPNTGKNWVPVIWTESGTITTTDGVTTVTNSSKSVIQTPVDRNNSSWLTPGAKITVSVSVRGQGSISFGYLTGSGWEDDSPKKEVDSDDYIRVSFTRTINSVHLDAGIPNFSVDAFCPDSKLDIQEFKAELNKVPTAYVE